MPILLAFDFDGVIVDSIQALKNVYHDFLSSYGLNGSDSEFELLNGPSIKEVVAILRKKYLIDENYDDLLEDYKSRLMQAYLDAPLMESALSTLQELKVKNIDLALVTSSVRTEVEQYLLKHEIRDYFKSVITGDEVSKSKPSPDIYLAIKEQFPGHSVWAIEDSRNGMKAATGAGLNVIYFDRFSVGTDLCVNSRINSLCELQFFVEAFERDCCVIEKSNAILIEVDESFSPKVNDQLDFKLAKVWEDASQSRMIQDDQVLYYLSHGSIGGKVIVKAFWAPYKYFYARLQEPSLGNHFVPLAVSGISLNEDNLVLIGRRTNVTEYESQIELVPSGGISSGAQEGRFVDFKRQLLQEFLEETHLGSNSVSSIYEIGIVKDMKNNVIDLCCLLEVVDRRKINPVESSEYKKISWVKVGELISMKLIPTSVGLLHLYATKDEG